mmetsp:Transcript_38772/g.153162  ORF Transcript_38772/g.153162 Transcript_38772/m.153162 type:complete len:208 (+) Transcript_38772:3981-4604(+)
MKHSGGIRVTEFSIHAQHNSRWNPPNRPSRFPHRVKHTFSLFNIQTLRVNVEHRAHAVVITSDSALCHIVESSFHALSISPIRIRVDHCGINVGTQLHPFVLLRLFEQLFEQVIPLDFVEGIHGRGIGPRCMGVSDPQEFVKVPQNLLLVAQLTKRIYHCAQYNWRKLALGKLLLKKRHVLRPPHRRALGQHVSLKILIRFHAASTQ